MSVIERFLAVLTPYECLGCSAEGDLLCPICIQRLPVMPERCYRCLQPSGGGLTCSICVQDSRLYRVRAAAPYSGVAKELVARLKFSGAQAAAREMAAQLSRLPDTPGGNSRNPASSRSATPNVTIVPVPTATGRVRNRGYDQARLLARELSRQTRLPCLDCLARSGHTHQVGASRQQRRHQLLSAFRVSAGKAYKIHGRSILLVDDVVTTGATLEAAASVLHAAGAKRVEAMVFAQA